MEVFNILDEKGRIKRIEFIDSDKVGQYDSHGMSYKGARDFIKKELHNKPFGLELLIDCPHQSIDDYLVYCNYNKDCEYKKPLEIRYAEVNICLLGKRKE